MIPLVLPQLVWALCGAPDLGPYRFDPVDAIDPSWTDPLDDSLRADRPVGYQAIVHDTSGRLIGRDTAGMDLHSGGVHWRRVQWSFGIDTVRSFYEDWSREASGVSDSMVKGSCSRGTCTTSARLWTVPTPEGLLSVLGYNETAANLFDRYDSTWRRTDLRGRATYSRTVRGSTTGNTTDRIEWMGEAPSVWTREQSSKGTLVQERHHPTWDGTRLLRDSVIRRTTLDNGSFSDTTIVRACSWDGPRVQSCFTLPDSATTALVEWSPEGRPLLRFSESGRMASWLWDERGRLVKNRQWGTETDLDSLVYGQGDLPERSLVFSCQERAPILPDTCTLRKTRTYLHSTTSVPLDRPAHGTRSFVRALEGDRLRFQGLGPDARRVVLFRLDGRILSNANPVSGECTLLRPEASGLALYGILDAKGRMIATGRVPGL